MPAIAPEDIKSNRIYEQGKPYFIQIDGEAYAVKRTANNTFYTSLTDFLKYGFFSQQDDYGIESWKAAGEDAAPYLFDEIPKMPNLTYITGITPLGLFLPNPGDTDVDLRATPRRIEAIDPNETGFFDSKKGNLYHELRSNLLFDDTNNYHYDVAEWIKFLEEKGLTYEKSGRQGILGLGIHSEPESILAGYFPKQGYLIVDPDFSEKIEELTSMYGLTDKESIDAMKRHVFLHEIAHALGVSGDRRGEELEGSLAYEFYTTQAEKFKGTKFEKIYKALAQRNRDYAEYFSAWNTFKRTLTKEVYSKKGSLEQLTAKLEAEGIALGYRGMELNRYVEHRVREIYSALIEDDASENEPQSRAEQSRAEKSYSKSKSSDSGKGTLEKMIGWATKGKIIKKYEKGEKQEYKNIKGKKSSYERREESRSEEESAREEPNTSDKPSDSKDALTDAPESGAEGEMAETA